jgi:adenine-specific DNA-methyltransferase
MQCQPNLYSLFIGLTVQLAKPNGIVGLVTPTSFLSGQYFGSLRTFLLKNTRVRRIGLVYERQRVYLDVQQETALTVLRANPPRKGEAALASVSVVKRTGRHFQIGECSLPNSGTSWPLARDVEDVKLIQCASRIGFRLSDYGYSPAVGGFVWNRDKRPAYLTRSRVPQRQRNVAVPLLWSSDIRNGGRLHFDTDAVAHGQHRYVSYGSLEHPTVKRRPAVLLQRVTSNDQPRRLIGAIVSAEFIREHGGYVGENHVVIVEQSKREVAVAPRQLLKLLETPFVQRYFRCISGSSNVSVFELEQLPLPDPLKLTRLLRRGLSIERAAEALLR